jgi:isoleucyl-tRNA synthetase
MPNIAGAEALKARWAGLREVRAAVSKQLEEARTAGKIGSSLQAEVLLTTSGAELPLLRSFEDDLRFVFITSQARVAESTTVDGVDVKVEASSHPKCERCWHYRGDVGSSAAHPTICGRCVSNLFGGGEKRFHA